MARLASLEWYLDGNGGRQPRRFLLDPRTSTPLDVLIHQEQLQLLAEALQGLAPLDREALLASARVHPRCPTMSSLARELGCSPQAIAQRANRAAAQIRRMLEDGIDA